MKALNIAVILLFVMFVVIIIYKVIDEIRGGR